MVGRPEGPGRRLDFDRPENRCFGCSPRNERGLRMVFHELAPGEIECRYTAETHWCGAPNVVHGGVQAALLDEVLGVAAHSGAGGDEDRHIVTAEFRLRYRRPVPSGAPLFVRGRLVRTEGRDYFVEGEIADAEGRVLTAAEARWRRIGPGA